uniref:Glycosyltransferase n=1 Tax=Ignisphaera aggregans TaxID=334771 RepID=A0A7J2U573_9CREN
MSIKDSQKILVISKALPTTGGGLRALRSLMEYSKHFDVYLFIPWGLWNDKQLLREASKYLRELRSMGIRFGGFSSRSSTLPFASDALKSHIAGSLFTSFVPKIVRIGVGMLDYDAIVVLHEAWDAVYSGYILAEVFDVPAMVLLQLPPFYGSLKRFENILKALVLWRRTWSENTIKESVLEISFYVRVKRTAFLRKLRYEKVLRCYDLVVGVSRAVAVDMSGEWVDRMYCFDPGVSLDDEDLELIKGVRARVREKQDYIVFGGRPVTEKGLAEALIAFKFISKRFPNLKLVFTGGISPEMYSYIRRVLRRFGIEDKVIFTGFVSRKERSEIVARAKLMLYPSHVDAFSYAVLESLHLGTPVVDYRIPALEIYYGKSPGVTLIEEGDIEALTVKAIDVLEKGVEAVEPPKIKSWREIMNEEIEIIRKLVSK